MDSSPPLLMTMYTIPKSCNNTPLNLQLVLILFYSLKTHKIECAAPYVNAQ